MSRMEIKTEPKAIDGERKKSQEYKESLYERGFTEQNEMNERFYVGDQWYGAKTGNSRPLVRRNIIKRIGEYKISSVGAAPVTVNYSADGIPETTDLTKEDYKEAERMLYSADDDNIASIAETPSDAEINAVMNALSDYQTVTAERLKFSDKTEDVLRSAYIRGTAFAYIYWDPDIETGLYADEKKEVPIKGDIAMETLDVDNVHLGDPNCDDIEKQPYIIIVQRKGIADVIREAEANGEDTECIKPDKDFGYGLTDNEYLRSAEPNDSHRVTVMTKLYKEYGKDGRDCTMKAVRVTPTATVRKPWELKIKHYPIAKFSWTKRRNSAYGDSEVTYLIPNQIAVNRALTASVWATMMNGMPKMVVNRDIVKTEITNNPGQIIEVAAGYDYDAQRAVGYVQPPSFAAQFENLVNDIASNTLSDSGANDAALGDIRPDNAAAIIQMREAALQPMQMYQNRYYSFIEDIARIFVDFWVNLYGNRRIKIKDKTGTRYMRFDAERYKKLIINAKVDVGASTLWSESVVVSTLDGLLTSGQISFVQYLERMPKGLIPDITGLINDATAQMRAQSDADDVMAEFARQYPNEYAVFTSLPPEQQEQYKANILKQMQGGGEE